jgi:hypothetical protein
VSEREEELEMALAEAVVAREHAEQELAAAVRQRNTAVRVAEEAMKMLSPAQVAMLRRRMDALEGGSGGERPGSPGSPGPGS